MVDKPFAIATTKTGNPNEVYLQKLVYDCIANNPKQFAMTIPNYDSMLAQFMTDQTYLGFYFFFCKIILFYNYVCNMKCNDICLVSKKKQMCLTFCLRLRIFAVPKNVPKTWFLCDFISKK